MAENDITREWEWYCDQIRHPALELGLFTGEDPQVCDLETGVKRPIEVPATEFGLARLRRGALLAAAALVYDQVLFDLAQVMPGTRATALLR